MDNHTSITDVPKTMSSALETSTHNNLKRTITITITITITTAVAIISPTKVQKIKLPKAMHLSVV